MQLPIELSHPCYHNEDAARAQLESIRWPDGPFCPICGSFDRVNLVKELGTVYANTTFHGMKLAFECAVPNLYICLLLYLRQFGSKLKSAE